MGGIGRDRRDLARHDKPLALRGVRSAFVGMAAVDHYGGVVEPVLKVALIGRVAN